MNCRSWMLMVCAALAMGLAGCGGGGGGGSSSAPVVRTWRLEFIRVAGAASTGCPGVAMYNGAPYACGEATYTLNNDGSLVLMSVVDGVPNYYRGGSWRIDGNILTLAMPGMVTERTPYELSGDTLVLSGTDGGTPVAYTLRRQ